MAKKAIRPIRIEGNVAYVPLTRGYEAIIDAGDVPLVDGFNWFAQTSQRKDGTVKGVYAARNFFGAAGPRIVYMHRVVFSVPSGLLVDHRDGDGLNNRRANLRAATQSQNGQNQRISTKNTSGYKGVTWDKRRKRWEAHIRIMGRRKFLGSFDAIEDAVNAYALASGEIHGPFGRVS